MRYTQLSWLIALPMLAACYSYTTVQVETVAPGTAVRARISGAEADSLSAQLGRPMDGTIDGQLLEQNEDAILLSVPSTISAGTAGSFAPTYQRVSLPRSTVFEIQVRRLDRWKTGAIVGLAAAVVGYVAVSQFGSEDATPGPSKPGSDK
jgi:hypothetical protein